MIFLYIFLCKKNRFHGSIFLFAIQSMQLPHWLLFQRGVLRYVVDLALGALKVATVTQFALPAGCCWRWSIWLWVLQSAQLSHILFSQRGAVGGGRFGFECFKACNCYNFVFPEGCCWRWLIWPWMFQSVQLSYVSLSQRGAVGGA